MRRVREGKLVLQNSIKCVLSIIWFLLVSQLGTWPLVQSVWQIWVLNGTGSCIIEVILDQQSTPDKHRYLFTRRNGSLLIFGSCWMEGQSRKGTIAFGPYKLSDGSMGLKIFLDRVNQLPVTAAVGHTRNVEPCLISLKFFPGTRVIREQQ